MHVGVLQFVTPRALPVGDLAVACEQRGIESLWVPEHPVVPVDYATRYPLSDDGKLPRPYTELPDPPAARGRAADKRLRRHDRPCPSAIAHDRAPGGDGD
jgi:alkanesulfonate monooxygenase SsuD/methylene tetrahydromethanopterin reductase-like flavin-dependent oxidoreductase (luciferase family)